MQFTQQPIFLALIAALLVVPVGGCDTFDQRDRTFSDDPRLEFSPLDAGVEEADLDGNGLAQTTVATNIQLIGPQRDSDLPVDFTVADSSTAQEGVHYSLPSTSATISANSNATEVSVTVLNNDQDDGGTNHVLYLNLQDGEDVEAATNLRTFTLTIEGSDE